MYKKNPQGWMKHWDFFLLDIIALQVSLLLAYILYNWKIDIYQNDFYRSMMFVFLFSQVAVNFFALNYKNILSRGYYVEFLKVLENTAYTFALITMFLFISKQGELFSRGTYLLTLIIYVLFSYILRIWRKKVLLKNRNLKERDSRSLILVAEHKSIKMAIEKLRSKPYERYEIRGIVITDSSNEKEIEGIRVVAGYDGMLEYICREWVDEVLISADLENEELNRIIGELILMGVTVHVGLPVLTSVRTNKQFIEKMGDYTVLTTSINMVDPKQLLLKRIIDILAGLAGCIVTGVLVIIIGPIIYIKSPGPIFFKQTRIGKNGRQFKMYKFRSMYMDAEARKRELMEHNKVKDGFMFKMDNDPRIIGCEKIRKDGTPGGIGNFIRRTSIDEFPQFLNVLKGDMSFVGTRPPTLDEWNKYELHHRARMAIKPGITGMWQANGRSEITDFEEIVKLDLEYIKNWSVGLDIKLIFLTFFAVLQKKGAE